VKELLLVLALLLSVGWLVVRMRRGKSELETASSSQQFDNKSAFHAVSLRYSSNACDAAKAMTGLRFLSSEAPKLPLPGCDAPECRCGFAHHSDRRSGTDRRSPFGAAGYAGSTGIQRKERRDGKNRRHHPELVNF
jgi:hypothetical protein